MSKSQTRVKPFKEQRPFLQDDKRYLGYVSGVGAGKTFSGIVRTIRNMTEWNPGTMGAIIAPTRQMIVNVIIPEMRGLGLFDAPVNWEYKSAYSDEPGIHAPNGSRALILSADNKQTVERLRGLNLSWVWMDERTAIPERAQEIAMQRLRIGDYRNLYITTTPKGKDDTYEFFVGSVDAQKGSYGEATIYETDDRRAIVGVPTSANPHTPEDYKEAMDSDLPDALRAQEVMGEFVEIGSGVLTKDMLDFVDADTLREDRRYQYIVGVDIGVKEGVEEARESDSDYTAAALVAVDKRDKVAYLLDIHRERGLSLRQKIQWLEQVCSTVPNPQVNIEEVAAQRFLLQEAREIGLNVTGVGQGQKKEDRIIQMSIPFEAGNVKLVNREKDPKLGYDERFREFVNEWIAFPEGSHDDAVDAVEIAMRNVGFGGMARIFGAGNRGDDDGST